MLIGAQHGSDIFFAYKKKTRGKIENKRKEWQEREQNEKL